MALQVNPYGEPLPDQSEFIDKVWADCVGKLSPRLDIRQFQRARAIVADQTHVLAKAHAEKPDETKWAVGVLRDRIKRAREWHEKFSDAAKQAKRQADYYEGLLSDFQSERRRRSCALTKEVCQRCSGFWGDEEEESWSHGVVWCCPREDFAAIDAKGPPEDCSYAAEHVVQSEGTPAASDYLLKEVCEQCVNNSRGEEFPWDDEDETRWDENGAVECPALGWSVAYVGDGPPVGCLYENEQTECDIALVKEVCKECIAESEGRWTDSHDEAWDSGFVDCPVVGMLSVHRMRIGHCREKHREARRAAKQRESG